MAASAAASVTPSVKTERRVYLVGVIGTSLLNLLPAPMHRVSAARASATATAATRWLYTRLHRGCDRAAGSPIGASAAFMHRCTLASNQAGEARGGVFTKVLIANRAEIAVRIARTCHELGVRVAAVYSDADRTALHVQVADEAYRIGPPPARESYLNIDAIIDAARQSGAEAVHPGYGFLSENAEFAERVIAAGLIWIGPPPAAIRAMGDKAAAKRLMAEAGVPVVPGYQGEEQSDERLREEAERIGYPLLIKASAGGGGRGMREVRSAEEFAEQLASARREALSAFGDDRMLLERLVERARHVELQVFGDSQGNVIYLGERDCSIQRRHQKVIEEAPSPAVDDELRRRMGEAAVRAAARVGYTNAGTVEFLLAEDRQFYFLEMNTRLQVEHPVSEMVTGLDLVKLQLEVAAGQPLPLRQQDVTINGHAIEARLYAEDPFNGFLPSSGTLKRYSIPTEVFRPSKIREDRGYLPGSAVSPYYDSLIAKIIAWSEDRTGAVAALSGTLAAGGIAGISTNLPLLRSVLTSESFQAGSIDVAFLERYWGSGIEPEPLALPEEAILAAAGYFLTAPKPRAATDPWQTQWYWRDNEAPRTLILQINGQEVSIVASPLAGADEWQFSINGSEGKAHIEFIPRIRLLVRRGASISTFFVAESAKPTQVSLHRLGGSGRFAVVLSGALRTPDAIASLAGTSGSGGRLTAPMPGVIVKLHVAEGDRVHERQTLAVLEAMKMEHAIQASADGVVKAVHVAEGDRVTGGQVLIEVEAA
jgi:3-methylcrotonyl-CoA carboxylase alpha subunit